MIVTNNGYRFWKVWNEHNFKVSSADVSDFAIFRMGEVMLNYAEATFEMGQFNQAIADATISKLRARGGVVVTVLVGVEVNTGIVVFDSIVVRVLGGNIGVGGGRLIAGLGSIAGPGGIGLGLVGQGHGGEGKNDEDL